MLLYVWKKSMIFFTHCFAYSRIELLGIYLFFTMPWIEHSFGQQYDSGQGNEIGPERVRGRSPYNESSPFEEGMSLFPTHC